MDKTVGVAVTAVLTSIVLAGVARAWRRQTSSSGTGDLRHPTVILVVALATGVPFLVGGLGALVFGNDPASALALASFSLLGAYLLWEYVAVRYSLSAEGFSYRTLAAGRGFARWSEVTTVLWSDPAKWFRIELSDGRVVRISVLMVGLDRFAQALLRGSSQAGIELRTKGVLDQCARGQPPSPWG